MSEDLMVTQFDGARDDAPDLMVMFGAASA
jgi:hypothetical protein